MNGKEMSVCTLCHSIISTIEYNLKLTCSSYSKSPLINFVKEMCNGLTNYNICRNCWVLFEELDSLILKQNIIYDKLKQYILKRGDKVTNTIKTEEATNPIAHSMGNIKYSTLNGNFNQRHNDLSEQIDQFIDTDTRTEDEEAKLKVLEKNIQFEVFKPEQELNTHLLTHDTQKQFVCEICGQAYKNKNSFKIHNDMHNGVSHFTCSYCNKTFTQKAALNRHMPIHTGEKPHQCDQCGKTFTHHTSFNLHKKSHAGQKPYKCSVCTLAFSSVSHLKRHTRIHTGEKRFICAICGKKFAEKYNLSVHEKTHNYKDSSQIQQSACNILAATSF